MGIPLKVALVVKHSSRSVLQRDCRNMGYWSYPVPEFQWRHFQEPFGHTELNAFDLVIQEDAGPKRYSGLRKPLVYVAIDSTLSEDHLNARLQRATNANLILVDHGPLEDFFQLNIPVKRWNYCVNDNLMRDYGEPKDIDVSFHCANGGNEERHKLRLILADYCQKAGLAFSSGILDLPDYARAMARSKIVVNWPKNPNNRPHRVFDAMACGACLITGRVPDVPGDHLTLGLDELQQVDKLEDMPLAIKYMLDTGKWEGLAQKGQRFIARYHTWAIRAKQLRAILESELGL